MSCLGSLDDQNNTEGRCPEGIKINVSCSFGQSLEWCPLTRCVENFHCINAHDQFCKRCKRETMSQSQARFLCLGNELPPVSPPRKFRLFTIWKLLWPYLCVSALWLGTGPAVPVQLCWAALCLKPGWVQLAFIPTVLNWAVCAAPGHRASFGSLLNAGWGLLFLGLSGCTQKDKWDLER